MKKLFLKSLALLMMLTMSVSMWATQFCGTTPYPSTDASGPSIYLTVTQSGNVYEMKAISATDGSYITGLLGDNMFCYTNNGTANCHMAAAGNYSYNATEHSVTFTVTSNAAPKIYTSLAFTFNTGNYTFTSANNLSWETCSGGGGTPTTPTAPTQAATTPDYPQIMWIYKKSSVSANLVDWGSGCAFDSHTYGRKVTTNGAWMGIVDYANKDASAMTHFHADIWCAENMSLRVVPIYLNPQDPSADKGVVVNVTGGQWNAIDIAKTEGDWAQISTWSNVHQIKLDNMTTGKTFYINNICFYNPNADNDAPVVTSAALDSKTHNSAVIAVAATDNVGVSKYIVKNGETQIGGEYTAVGGKITVNGLTANTAYTLTVYAKDVAGNVSEGFTMTQFTTNALIYDNFPTGHLADPNFGDINGRILLTIAKVNDHKIAVKAVHNGGSQAVKYMNVIVNGAAHEFGTADAAADDLEDFVFVDGIASLSSFTFNLIFFCNTPNWTTQNMTITEDQLASYYSGLANPELTITTPATATVEKTVGEQLTVAYTSLNTAAATITSNSACVTVEGNTLTAVKPGTAIITVAQAATAEYEAADATFTVNVSGTKEANTECAGWNDDMLNWGAGYTYAFTTTATDVVLSITPDNNLPVGAVGQIQFFRRDGGDGVENGSCQIDGNTLTWTFSIDGILKRDGNPYLWNDNTIHFKPYMPSSMGVGSTSNVIVYHIGEDCANHAVESVSITTAPDELIVGQNTTLVATITPTNATNKNMTWSVESGAEYASVTSAGVLTANAPGEVVVKVTSEDGSKTDTKTIQIVAPSVDVKTYSAYHHNDVVYMLYSVTRNVDKTLTFANLIDATMDVTKQVHIYNAGGEGHFDEWHNLTKNNETGKYEFTTTRTFEQDEAVVVEFYCAYPGAACSKVFDYTVGAEQAAPVSIALDKIVLSQSSASLSVGEDLQLTARAYPSFADNTTITWAVESGTSAGVSATGNVHANAAGETVIKAFVDETMATCTVNVASELVDEVFHGASLITIEGKRVAANWTVTRTTDRKLVYNVVFDEDMTGKIMQVKNHDDNFVAMQYDAATKTATFTSTTTYADGATVTPEHFLYFGGPRIELGAYVVGSSNDAVNVLLTIHENADNSAKLSAVNTATIDAALTRTLKADYWNTFCVPFDVTAEQLAEVMPGAEVMVLADAYLKSADMLYLDFQPVDALTAGTAYLVKPAAEVKNPLFKNVVVNAAAPVATGNGYASMTGYYGLTTVTAGNYWLSADSYLYEYLESFESVGMRCYFSLSASLPAGVRARVVFGTNVTTGIDAIEMTEGVQKVMVDGAIYILRADKMYSIDGQLVK